MEGIIRIACSSFEGGRREKWCAAIVQDFEKKLKTIDGESSSAHLERICKDLFGSMTSQMRRKGLRFLRSVVGSVGEMRPLLERMPRFLRTEPDRLLRQRRVVLDDSLPRRLEPAWLREVFEDIVASDKTSAWKTSKTARQQLSMVYKFLRSSHLLGADHILVSVPSSGVSPPSPTSETTNPLGLKPERKVWERHKGCL